MERIVDKLFLACIGLLLLLVAGPLDAASLALYLVGMCLSAACELNATQAGQKALSLACLATTLLPGATPFALPLAMYDLRWASWWRYALVGSSLVIAVGTGEPISAIALCSGFAALAYLLSERTEAAAQREHELHALRDSLQEKVLDLETSQRELVEARDYEARAAMLAERARISREIHDNVGHLLTRSILQIEAFEVIHGDDPEVQADFHEVGNTVREALDVTRASVHAMADDAVDLALELQRLAHESKIEQVNLSCEADDVPVKVTRCFVAVCREALTNAARHAQARHANILVAEFPGLWQLLVTNDGSIPHSATEQQLSSDGMGIRSMRERVEALGGTFRISCERGKFSVFASIPRS